MRLSCLLLGIALLTVSVSALKQDQQQQKEIGHSRWDGHLHTDLHPHRRNKISDFRTQTQLRRGKNSRPTTSQKEAEEEEGYDWIDVDISDADDHPKLALDLATASTAPHGKSTAPYQCNYSMNGCPIALFPLGTSNETAYQLLEFALPAIH